MARKIRRSTAEIAAMDPRGYRTIAATLRPPPKLTASQWAESGALVLPEGTTSMPGPMRFDMFPYWRMVLDWVSDRITQELIACVSSQHGKTNFCQAAALYSSFTDPGPVLWLMPTDQQAEEFMRDRFRPMIRASPAIKSQIMRSGSQSADRMDGVQWISGGYTNVSGVAASQKLKGKPVRVLIADEVDEMIKFNPELGDPRERMRTRLRTFSGRSKLILDSTPTAEDIGIWSYMQTTQQWTWGARCPHCGHVQQMLFPQVKWEREDGKHPDPDKLAREHLAYYECIECAGHWDDAQRNTAVQSGEGMCLTPDRGGEFKSVHLNVLTSPLVSLSVCAAQFLRCKENQAALIQFKNEWLAEPVTATVSTNVTGKSFLETLRTEMDQGPEPGDGDVPDDVRVIVGGADVQGDHLWAVYVGICNGGKYRVLWAGRRQSLSDLADDARAPWLCRATGEYLKFVRGFVDSGYRTAEVYEFCRLTGGLWQSVKGGHDEPVPIQQRNVARAQGGRGRAIGGDLVNILSPMHFKDELDRLLGSGNLTLPKNASELYLRHLTSEVKKYIKTPTGQRLRWVPRYNGIANHMLDATYYAIAAAWSMGLQNMRPASIKPEPVDDPQQRRGPYAIPEKPNSLGFKPMTWK